MNKQHETSGRSTGINAGRRSLLKLAGVGITLVADTVDGGMTVV